MAATPREMANAIRFLALDAMVHVGDGHPGTPLGAADICTALFTRHLRFDPACLASHEARRNVRTASAAQVRQPLRRDTARASAYGALLDPLRAALEPPR